MHVLVIPSWYATAANPVRGSFFKEQALALQRASMRVGVLVIPARVRTWHGLAEIRRARGRASQLVQRDDQGLPTYQLDWWGLAPSLLPQRRLEVVLQAFDRYVAEQGPVDVIHAHGSLYAGYMAAHLRAERGIPVVLTEHMTALVNGRLFPDQRARAAHAVASADRCLAVGTRLAAALRRLVPGVDVQVVGNVIDTDFFTPASSPPARQPFVMTVVGGLVPRKGVDVLIEAFQRVFRGQPVTLQVVGKGRERQRLEQLVQRWGIGAQVRFHGALSRVAVRDLLRTSHALVSASHLETFGVTLIEAMACGLPVVATRSGGPEDIVTSESGLLVPPGDPAALAEALSTLVRDYDRFDPRTIRGECITRFSEAAITSTLRAIYGELVGSRESARAESSGASAEVRAK